MDGLTLADLLSLAGVAVVVSIVLELVKRTLSLSDQTIDRFGPLLACASGAVISTATASYLNVTQTAGIDLVQAGLTGFLAGALAAGLYATAGEKVGVLVEQISGGRIS